jgi:RHS repeat-associated protein
MMRFQHYSARRKTIAAATTLICVAGMLTAVKTFGSSQTASSAPASSPAVRPVAVRPVAVRPAAPHRDVNVHLTRSWRAPRTVWPAAQAGTAMISSASASRESQAPAGPTPGSGRAGHTQVWVGPPATSDTRSPVRRKTRLSLARYPRYEQRGKLAARPRGAPATGLPGADLVPLARPVTGRDARGISPAAASAPSSSSSPVRAARVQVFPRQAAEALGIKGTVFTIARADGRASAGRVHVSFDYAAFRDAYGGDYAARLHLVELPSCALTTPAVASCRLQTPVVSGDDVKSARTGADVTLPGAAVTSARTVVMALTPSAQGSAGDYAAEPVSEMTQWLSGNSSGAYEYTYPITEPPVPGGLEPSPSLQYDSQLTDGISAAANPEASETGDGWQSVAPGSIEINYQTCAANFAQPDILDLCDQVQSQTLTLNGETGPVALTSSGKGYKEENDDDSNVQQLSGGGWEIIESDGTQYYFGLNKLPGWVSGDPVTNSIWTVPLWYGDSEVTPDGAWRYMLDYEVDPNGNSIAYFYNAQNNYYATDGGSTANGEYTSGGVLVKAEYGLRNNGNVYSQTPAAEINYSYSSTRQDAPTDLACTNGAACSVNAPTFWTSDALTGISTESLVGSSLEPVDSYQFTDSYPATGDPSSSPNLWLSSIQQTGEDGSTPVTLPPADFAPTPMPNLDQTSTDKTDGYSLITRDRLTAITNDTGGVTKIAYTAVQTACSSGSFPTLWTNSDRCYPDYWYTNPIADTERLDWYNLYAQAQVTKTDTTGGGEPVVTGYTYGTPGWHYDNDGGSTSAYPTWDEWRGFQTVTTETGTSPEPVTETTDTFYQGLSNDEGAYSVNNGGEEGTGTITITTSRGVKVTDADQYAGMMLEQRIFNGAGGSEVTDTEYDVPWSKETAAQTYNSTLFEYVDAYLDDNTGTVQYTDLASGGSDQSTVTETLDSTDDVLSEDIKPWGAAETCTTTSYVTNTTSNLTEPYVVKVNSGSCSSPGALVSETQYAYDGGAFGAAPTQGLVTGVEKTISSSGTTALTTTAYDEYGRVTSSTDPDSRTTTTAYTPATGAEPTQVTVTDPMGLATVTTYDPARELPLSVTTPAGDTTAYTYDALGRTTAKWTPGNPTTGSPQVKYAFAVSQTAPEVVTTQTQEPGGNYLTSETLYDSLGREAEVQAGTASGGSDVTQYTYNSDGMGTFAAGPYYTSSAPSGTLLTASQSSVPDETGYTYDGAGRPTAQTAYDDGTATWSSTLTYGGNYVTDVPPSGGTSETIFNNGLDQETAFYQYHAGVAASPSDPASDYDQTSYGFNAAGTLASVTDAANNQWSYTYDLLGDQLTQKYPDSGTTTATYDAAGQLMSETDARGKATSFTYDKDGRKTGEYDTTGGAPENSSTEIASWTWDTLAKGLLTSATSYSGGAAYTEEATGYNSEGLPQGQSTVIPSAQGALAGTYTTSYTYAPDGSQLSYTDSAAGGLPSETVTTGYNTAGEPDSLTGASTYVGSLSYTNLGQPLEYALGTSAAPVDITDSYDPETANLTEQQVQAGTAATTVDDLHYGYDADGLITSEADTPAGAPSDTDVQCFSYDYLARLAEAWAQGSTGCAANPTSANEGGPAPFLNQYSYNTVNNLTGVTSTAPTGTVTTTTFGYPPAGNAGPHQVTSSSTTVGSGSPSTSSYGYDADGNLTTVTNSTANQALTWSDAGQLTQIAVTPAGGTAQDTGFVYDASGNELIRTDPGTVTLYLSDEELVLKTSTGTVTGTRYYSISGQVVAASTAASGAVSLAWLAGDSQQTEAVAISASTLTVTRRWYDPYGNPVGPGAPAFPDGEKGFVGGTTDTATGLVNLGVRQYQSATGSFISPDPLTKPFDPQDLNPYAYVEDDPASESDPTGASGIPIGEGKSFGAGKATFAVPPLGVLDITVSVNVSATPGASVLNVTAGADEAVVQVQGPAGGDFNFKIPYEGLDEKAVKAAQPLPRDYAQNKAYLGYCDYCEVGHNIASYKGNDLDITIGPLYVTLSLSGSKVYGAGKNKVSAGYEIDATFHPLATAPKGTPTVSQALSKALNQAAASANSITGFIAGILTIFDKSAQEFFANLLNVGEEAGENLGECVEDNCFPLAA